MAHSVDDFPVRLGYVRWLWHLDNGEPPTNEAISAAAGHTGQWLTGLIKDGRTPTKAADHKALATFFAVSREWFFENQGDAPRPSLWRAWRAAREAQAKVPRAVSPTIVEAVASPKRAKDKKVK